MNPPADRAENVETASAHNAMVPLSVSDPIDRAADRLRTLEHLVAILTLSLLIAVGGLVVCGSGWWLTSRDQSATEAGNAAADCRSQELATTLDEFVVIVSPQSTGDEVIAAAGRLGDLDALVDRYAACTHTATTTTEPGD